MDDRITAAAQRIVEHLRRGFGTAHAIQEADLAAFAWLQRRGYERAGELFAAHGYRPLADVCMPDLFEGSLLRPTVCRLALSPQAGLASYYQVYMDRRTLLRRAWRQCLRLQVVAAWRGLARRWPRRAVVDVTAAFDDGSFVVTGNAQAAGVWERPPEVDALQLAYHVPARAVLAEHARRVTGKLASTPGCRLRVPHTLDEVRAQSAQRHALRRAHRERVGWITCGELRRLGTGPVHVEALRRRIGELLQAGDGPE